jgi:hypothetical protein
MRRLWKRVHVAGFSIPVYLHDNLENEGEYHYDKHEIRIDACQPRQKWGEIVLHESLHAIDDVHGLKLSERQVRALSLALHQAGARIREAK